MKERCKIKYVKTKHGKDIPCFIIPSCDSTNTLAKQYVSKYLPQDDYSTNGHDLPQNNNLPQNDDFPHNNDLPQVLPFALIAQQQTAGRGRYDRTFLSLRAKGAYLTLVLGFDDYQKLPQLSCVCALAVADLLCDYGVQCALKWPNDVCVNGKKICGILCQSGETQTGQKYALLGVGVNLNYTSEDFGALSKTATSLLAEYGKKTDATRFALRLVSRLYEQVVNSFATSPVADYRKLCSTIGKKVFFTWHGKQREGVAIEVGQDMSLTVDTAEGVISLCYGEITEQKYNI